MHACIPLIRAYARLAHLEHSAGAAAAAARRRPGGRLAAAAGGLLWPLCQHEFYLHYTPSAVLCYILNYRGMTSLKDPPLLALTVGSSWDESIWFPPAAVGSVEPRAAGLSFWQLPRVKLIGAAARLPCFVSSRGLLHAPTGLHERCARWAVPGLSRPSEVEASCTQRESICLCSASQSSSDCGAGRARTCMLPRPAGPLPLASLRHSCLALLLQPQASVPREDSPPVTMRAQLGR